MRLVEQPNGDFAASIARLFLTSTWRLALMERLRSSADPVLAAIAAKAVKELAYHRDYAARWVVRLGDGTELSRRRMEAGLAAVWPFLDELSAPSSVETALSEVAVDPSVLRAEMDAVIDEVLAAATLERPSVQPDAGGGRAGRHTEHLAPLLAEMQEVARAHEGATW